MKKLIVCMSFLLVSTLVPLKSLRAQIPIAEIIKQAIKKVIIAVDLKIQRLQTKTIWLQNAQKVVENKMSKVKLDEITDWVEKQRALYKDYFDELWKVKEVLTYYSKVKDIAAQQILLVKEYKTAWRGVQQDGHFTKEEVRYMGKVYTGIIEESLKNLEGVALVITSFTTQMSDARRIQMIDAAAAALQQNYADLKAFNTQNIQLSLQRSKDEHDIGVVKALYGIQKTK